MGAQVTAWMVLEERVQAEARLRSAIDAVSFGAFKLDAPPAIQRHAPI